MPGRKKKETRGAKGHQFPVEVILRAIDGSGGIMSRVRDKLKCDWTTAESHVKKHKETRQAWDDEVQIRADEAEVTIREAVAEGDVGAAKWFLSKRRPDIYGDEPVKVEGELTVKTWVIEKAAKKLENDSHSSAPDNANTA